jgi:hypothetical protein
MKVSEDKISIIIPFFSKTIPPYVRLYLKSVELNPVVEVLFFTNLDFDHLNPPTNMKIFKMELSDINSLIKTKLDLEVELKDAYKLCDYKPTYGLLFEDYIQHSHYWAFGDIDLIYGNLENYPPITNNVFDIISFRKDWISGSLTYFRNNDFNKYLFKKSKDWETILKDTNQHYAFDEISSCTNGEDGYALLIQGKTFEELNTEVESFTEVVKKETSISTHFETLAKESISKSMLLSYKDRSIFIYTSGNPDFQKGREFPYYHFITEKKNGKFEYPKWKEIPDKFYISQYGFHKNLDKIELLFFFREVLFKLKFSYRIAKRAYNKFFKAA